MKCTFGRLSSMFERLSINLQTFEREIVIHSNIYEESAGTFPLDFMLYHKKGTFERVF